MNDKIAFALLGAFLFTGCSVCLPSSPGNAYAKLQPEGAFAVTTPLPASYGTPQLIVSPLDLDTDDMVGSLDEGDLITIWLPNATSPTLSCSQQPLDQALQMGAQNLKTNAAHALTPGVPISLTCSPGASEGGPWQGAQVVATIVSSDGSLNLDFDFKISTSNGDLELAGTELFYVQDYETPSTGGPSCL